MSTETAPGGILRTRIPARLDRLPWSKFHWRIVIGLGTVWILDGIEVTIVGALGSRLTEKGSGIAIDSGQILTAGAVYVAGACLGALFFGQLTDRFGRKKLFMITLGVYIIATVATAFATTPLFFFVCRFFTGSGIGGEYAAINSAIDELIPARARGQVDIGINGSFWLGSILGSLAALLFLDEAIFAKDFGWRLAFGLGALLGIGILIVRRHVPESPRWLFIHGREQEAEEIVTSIEAEVREESHQELTEPRQEIAVHQRKRIPFREIAKVAFTKYPKRAWLGLALFVGQAFLYNSITFGLGTILSKYFDVASGSVPFYTIIFAAGNLLGPLLLGRLFDTVGRKPMISSTYIFSALGGAVLAVLMLGDSLTSWSFIAIVGITFFFASAGASAAYLTVSEIFPMETRALAIAFFYAIGTALGGITGPLLFGKFVDSGNQDQVATGFFIGAAVMLIGGIAELVLGVRAEGRSLEDIAKPLTAEEAEGKPLAGAEDEVPTAAATTDEDQARTERIRARSERMRARETTGRRRYRPGPGTGPTFGSPGMLGTAGWSSEDSGEDLDREIEIIARALQDRGPAGRDELYELVAARYWGPGRFRAALREAVEEGAVRRVGRNQFTAAEDAPT
jgi:MFS family permease